MNYYVRQDKEGEVMGPFSGSEIVSNIESGILSPDVLATTDLGESKQQLKPFRRCDWFSVLKVPEVGRFLNIEADDPAPENIQDKSRMPIEMKAISGYYILAALGYIWANVMQWTGMARVSNLPTPIFGMLTFVMWLGIAFCIISRIRWGWHFCLAALSVEILKNLQTFAGHNDLASWQTSAMSALLLVIIGNYLLKHRHYFSESPLKGPA